MLPDYGAPGHGGSSQCDGGSGRTVPSREREPMIQVCEWVESAWLVGFGVSEGVFEIHLGKWIVRLNLPAR